MDFQNGNAQRGKWFANRGQIIEIIIAIGGLALGIFIAWPTMKASGYFTPGAILVYLLVGLVVFMIARLLAALRNPFASEASPANSLEAPPAPFDPGTHPHEDFPVTRKTAIYDKTPGRSNPSKVYIEMLNNMTGCVEIEVSRWLSGIRAEALRAVLQLWLGNGWYPTPDGLVRLYVPPGERFRFWVAPDKQYSTDELQRLCDAANFGVLMIRVNGKERGIFL